MWGLLGIGDILTKVGIHNQPSDEILGYFAIAGIMPLVLMVVAVFGCFTICKRCLHMGCMFQEVTILVRFANEYEGFHEYRQGWRVILVVAINMSRLSLRKTNLPHVRSLQLLESIFA